MDENRTRPLALYVNPRDNKSHATVAMIINSKFEQTCLLLGDAASGRR